MAKATLADHDCWTVHGRSLGSNLTSVLMRENNLFFSQHNYYVYVYIYIANRIFLHTIKECSVIALIIEINSVGLGPN